MGLDFHHTCSGIDANIRDFKSIITDYFEDLLGESSPLVSEDVKYRVKTEYAKNVYNDCENIFEDLRKCNEDMRQQAEKQLDELENRIDDLESDLYNANERIKELEDDLDKSEDRCIELENKIAG